MRALIEPAIAEARRGGPHPIFDLLQEETAALTREPTGVGLDLPHWLIALEEEVEQARLPAHEKDDPDLEAIIPCLPMPPEEVERQLDEWTNRE
jgi:hypothetical protein